VRNCAAVQSRPFNIAQILNDALSLHQQGRLREAEKLYMRALKAAPDNFDALHLLGLINAQNGQMGEAYRLMSAALKINPNAPDVLINFANVLHGLKRDDEALASIDKALALRPDDPGALLHRGNTLIALNRPNEALPCFDAVLARSPGHRDALLSRGVARATLGHHGQALADFDTILARMPTDAETLYNRGTALIELGRYAEALLAFDHALAGLPQHLRAWTNRGRALQALNRHEEAVASFDKALAVDKNCGDAHFNAALSLLTLENLQRGFAEYEWRWKRTGMSDARRSYRGRLWLGEFPLDRRTILLPAEQGLGDTIQFVRYVPLLAQMGANVILEVQPELKTLLSTPAALHHVMRAAKRCRLLMSIVRSAACRLRSRPSLPRSRPLFPIFVLTMRTPQNGVRRSRRCPGNGSLWPGPAMHVMPMTATDRSISSCSNRSLPPKAFHS